MTATDTHVLTDRPLDVVHRILGDLDRACDGRAILWRGPDLTGRDVDVLLPGTLQAKAIAVLVHAGLRPVSPSGGWGAWVDPGGLVPPIDVMPEHRWPARYHDIDGVLRRADRRAGIATTAAEDRLLFLASDAVAGRDLDRVASRMDRILAREPQARAGLSRLARSERFSGAEALVEETVGGAARRRRDRRGRLRLRTACRLALSSPLGRQALRHRVLTRARSVLARVLAMPRTSRRGNRATPAPLVTVSGMDGSGKSTLVSGIERHLAARGRPVQCSWTRLGNELVLLDGMARPVKRILRRTGTVADPDVAAHPGVPKRQAARAAAGRRGLVDWCWILVVAMVATHTHKRNVQARRRGVAVVADRWTSDALVDLELRYGRHRLADRVIRTLLPEPDLALLLQVDPRTAASRNPGDKAPRTLEAMQVSYARAAEELGMTCLDATMTGAEVLSQAAVLVDAVLERRAAR